MEKTTVLIVDDEQHGYMRLVRMALESIFEKENLEVLEAETMESAETILATRNDLNLVLLDFNINGRDGIELIKPIRETQPKCVIAACSQHEENNALMMGSDADVIIGKELAKLDRRDLLEQLRTLVLEKLN